jgi:hypothetical protein
MRKFLHVVTEADFVEDHEGADFPNLGEALVEARLAARDLIVQQLMDGRPVPFTWRIRVCDESGAVEAEVPFTSVIIQGALSR